MHCSSPKVTPNLNYRLYCKWQVPAKRSLKINPQTKKPSNQIIIHIDGHLLALFRVKIRTIIKQRRQGRNWFYWFCEHANIGSHEGWAWQYDKYNEVGEEEIGEYADCHINCFIALSRECGARNNASQAENKLDCRIVLEVQKIREIQGMAWRRIPC